MATISDTVNLKVNENYLFKLPSLGTSGYEWQFSTDKAGIVEITEVISTAKESQNIAGGISEAAFNVKGLTHGKTTIVLEQKRRWEKEVKPLETRILRIEVN